MTKDTALKMAIEALDTLMMEKDSIYQQALEACKEALEQPTADTPPSREWVGLSEDEISHLKYLHVDYELFDEGEYGTECNVYVDDFARAIEQALKEKNNG